MMARGQMWAESQWKEFAKRVWELRKTPEHMHRVYWGPTYLEAQKHFPLDLQHAKSYFSAQSKEVKAKVEGYFAEFNNEDAIEARAAKPPVDAPVPSIAGVVVDYEKLAQILIARLRDEVEDAIEVFCKAELDERLKGVNNVGTTLPHWVTKNGSKADGIKKIRVALFGIEEKNRNTARFNYLKHCVELRIFEGVDHVQAKHTADTAEFCIIASNSDSLTKQVITEVKKSKTKNIFTSGGLSAVDAALQTFCQSKGLRYTAPEHPSKQG